MTYSLFDIDKPGNSPAEIVKRTPPARRARSFGESSDKPQVLGLRLIVTWGTCATCGNVTIQNQSLLFQVQTTEGVVFQHTPGPNMNPEQALAAYPNLPKTIRRVDHKVFGCVECFAAGAKEVADSWGTAEMGGTS